MKFLSVFVVLFAIPPTKGSCVKWDLSLVSIDQNISFVGAKKPGFVSFDGDPPDIWSYWDRVENTNQASGKQSLFRALRLPRTGQASLYDAMKQTGPGEGVFVFLRGDSHLRIVLSMALITMSRDPDVMKAAGYNRKTYHHPHLFCCPRFGMKSADLPFKNCTVEIGAVSGKHFLKNKQAFDEAVVESTRAHGGQFCIFWELHEVFWVERESQPALVRWQAAGRVPDLLVVNGGAHYSDFMKGGRDNWRLNDPRPTDKTSLPFHWWMKNFEVDATEWFKANVEDPLNVNGVSSAPSAVVLLSSPPSTFSPWPTQVQAFEVLRRLVSGLPAGSTAQRRTSYLDFHTLMHADSCGFTHAFPFRAYKMVNMSNHEQVNACGHRIEPLDVHLSGGAYLHLLEMVLNLMRLTPLNGPRCNPPPYQGLSANAVEQQVDIEALLQHGRLSVWSKLLQWDPLMDRDTTAMTSPRSAG